MFQLFKLNITLLTTSWEFIGPNQFTEIISGQRNIERSSILITFDDGFNSHRLIAEKILNPLGIKALFFVITNFINIECSDKCKKFISKNIIPGLPEDKIQNHSYNMHWDDLKYLIDTGHTLVGIQLITLNYQI